MGNMRC